MSTAQSGAELRGGQTLEQIRMRCPFPERKMQQRQRSRDQLKKYLQGTGIEIGALHKPLALRGRKVRKVIYVDRLSTEEQRSHYPELDNLALVVPDIIDDGTMLEKVENGSVDFIIANHLLEHLDNPLLALENWCKKLKPGGVVYMAIPDKRYTFDRERPVTPLSHLVEDYQGSEKMRAQRNAAHYVETAEIIEGRVGEDARERVESLVARGYSIHFHAWTFESFVEALSFVTNEMRVPYRILDYSTPLPGGDEFIFILGKEEGKRRDSRQGGLLRLVQRIADFLPGGHQREEPA